MCQQPRLGSRGVGAVDRDREAVLAGAVVLAQAAWAGR